MYNRWTPGLRRGRRMRVLGDQVVRDRLKGTSPKDQEGLLKAFKGYDYEGRGYQMIIP